MHKIKSIIEKTWENPEDLIYQNEKEIDETIKLLEEGFIRIASKENEKWKINEWIKKAILLYFKKEKTEEIKITHNNKSIIEYRDKIKLKKNLKEKNIRALPGSIIRYGSYINTNTVIMPSFINIGSYIDTGTMIDTWATVGSCAQIGKNVHISGGVGIGGVLEPLQGSPVIIEDNVFVGSRSIIVEGAHIEKEAVIAANVVITASTKIIDVTKNNEKIYKGYVPEKSIVIPGTYKKEFNSGEYNVPCALIIGKRKDSTNKKTSLNEALREFDIKK
tara:strand:+ start:207 stop:1034 length:828 start_codon:yes stop_codon:yes gene_type:complete